MRDSNFFARLVERAVHRPLLTVAIAAALALAAAAVSLVSLKPSTSVDTLVDRSSPTFKATERYRTMFGGDTVVILAKGDLRHTIETSDLGRLLTLEGCIAGNVPANALAKQPPVCRRFAQTKP